jgi:mannose-6-phosphate isomerase-like protein (cupin superfamily)
MKRLLMAAVMVFAQAAAQSGGTGAVLVNGATAKWAHDAGDPPGSESITLREDARTGAMELMVRYPAGHVFSPHWHTANERMIVIEGRMSLRDGDKETFLDPGGYAYLPAKEVQRMSCVSKTRCAFYVYWDGKLDFNPAR